MTDERRRKLSELLAARKYLPLAEVCAELGISEATARRDLASLEREHLIKRTHGGAIAPYSGALGDFETFFPTFDQRRTNAPGAKAAISAAVVAMLTPDTSVFIDSGSTCYAVAERLEQTWAAGRGRLRVVTHNLAVAVKLASVDGVEVEVLGGTLLPRQAGLFGDETCRAVSGRRIELAVMGCEGMDSRGLWNSQKDVVRVQRAAMAAAERRVFAMDASKAGNRAPVFLTPWSDVDVLVTDADAAVLRRHEIALPGSRLVHVSPGVEEVRKRKGSS